MITGSAVLDGILGVATTGGLGISFAAIKKWTVSHALTALQIEGPRAVSTAGLAYAAAIEAGKSPAEAGETALDAARTYLTTTISGPLAKLKKSETVIETTAQGIAAQAVQQATKVGVPAALVAALQPIAGEVVSSVVQIGEDQLDKLAEKVSAKLGMAPTTPPTPAPAA
ncbi:hypothetical protein [Rhizosaccharibacter radicis]|uniref:DUF937 domain-containing protein n=1 Tax=Rhizosaccharibacter radicis TaxID=2782605 RepID=A0ABT1VVY9_9PROT|nr:hypothetical protein [Acetobacteraceae bacterium KSS12]